MTRPPRATVLLTGSELVRGTIRDANGPFLARELTRLGLEPSRWLVVGDRPDELEAGIAAALEADLCILSGGLGPTHDDRTIELLARVTGRRLVVDEGLAAEIDAVARRVAARVGRPYEDLATGVRKQASLPEGGVSLGLAGTAPAVLLEHEARVAVALPGPPGELRRLWPNVLEAEPVRRVAAGAAPREHRVLRLFEVPEAAVAAAVAAAGGEGDGLELTVCARNFEIEVDLFAAQDRSERADAVARELEHRFADAVFARDERPVAEIVLDLLRGRGLTFATAESCTGGLVGALVTDVPGASDVFLGSIVAYADAVKREALRVTGETLRTHGAVSAQVAAEMAAGARRALGADVAVAVTGVAGPGGGSAEKPVGLVHVHVSAGDAEIARELRLYGGRDEIRMRAAVVSLHEVRRLLTRSATHAREPAA